MIPRKPTPAELAAAQDKAIPDVLGPQLRILFCGIDPSLYDPNVINPNEINTQINRATQGRIRGR